MFAFIKDTYNYTDTVCSTTGNSSNSLEITGTNLSGDKFEFEYKFSAPLTESEKESLDASILLIDTANNSIVYNFGKFTDNVLLEKPISVDLSSTKMGKSEYILKFSVGTGNNVFYIAEFTLSKKLVEITLDENATSADVAKILKEKGLIEHPFAFKLYANYKKDKNKSLSDKYLEGTHQLFAGMDYDEIISALSPNIYVRSTVKLTFPEGSTVDEIIDILIKGGVKNSKEDYLKAMEDFEKYDYRFLDLLKEQGLDEDRVYSLEGYLFPDTYEFYTDSSPETVIDKFLANFDAKFDNSFYDEADRMGLTVDELVRIASLVESEAGNAEDKGNISSVFHNRLANSSKYPRLESDATTDYASFNLKSNLKFTEFTCKKCAEKSVKAVTSCPGCGNTNSYEARKQASFATKLSDFKLADGEYYISFTISTKTTRAKSLIYFSKKTNGEKITYKVKSDKTESTPANGDIHISVAKAEIDSDGVLSCDFDLSHNYDYDEVVKMPSKLNLYRTAYDTYETNGLMPSAVSNPGYESIIAAIYPNATNYYFFVADKSGNSHFSTTLDQHNQAIASLVNSGNAVSNY